jgi:hypothetical protein
MQNYRLPKSEMSTGHIVGLLLNDWRGWCPPLLFDLCFVSMYFMRILPRKISCYSTTVAAALLSVCWEAKIYMLTNTQIKCVYVSTLRI